MLSDVSMKKEIILLNDLGSKSSEEACILILIYFDSFDVKYSVQLVYFKDFSFYLISLRFYFKGSGNSSQGIFFAEIFDKSLPFIILP